MRVGAWNLAGRWDARHLALIETMDCDVLLLTEVSERVELPGHDLHLGDLLMAPKRRWAAVHPGCATQRHHALVGDIRISDHDAHVVGAASGRSVE